MTWYDGLYVLVFVTFIVCLQLHDLVVSVGNEPDLNKLVAGNCFTTLNRHFMVIKWNADQKVRVTPRCKSILSALILRINLIGTIKKNTVTRKEPFTKDLYLLIETPVAIPITQWAAMGFAIRSFYGKSLRFVSLTLIYMSIESCQSEREHKSKTLSHRKNALQYSLQPIAHWDTNNRVG